MKRWFRWILAVISILFIFVWARSYWRLDSLTLMSPRGEVTLGASEGSWCILIERWYGPKDLNDRWKRVYWGRNKAEPLSPYEEAVAGNPGFYKLGSFVVFSEHEGFSWRTGFVL